MFPWLCSQLISPFSSIPVGSGDAIALPQTESLPSTDIEPSTMRHSDRQGRAMYFTKTTPTASTTKTPLTIANTTETSPTETNDTQSLNRTLNKTDETDHPTVHWTPINTTEIVDTNETVTEDVRPETTTTLAPKTNVTEHNATVTTSKKRNNLTRHPEIKDNIDLHIEGVAESRIVTEKPLSLETTFLQTRVPPNIESYRRVIDQPDRGGMDTGAIAGISFAALVLAALAGSTAFVLYRRRYLNKPQTLNDKCSNPDSSGYLDDSTIRVRILFILYFLVFFYFLFFNLMLSFFFLTMPFIFGFFFIFFVNANHFYLEHPSESFM